MVCFDWEEEERDLCLQNFFWDKKSFDSDLNKRMHALQKLERFWYFFSRFLNLWVKLSLVFLSSRLWERAALFSDEKWENEEIKRREKRKGRDKRERIFLLFSGIFFLIGKNVWIWYRALQVKRATVTTLKINLELGEAVGGHFVCLLSKISFREPI